MSDHITNIPDHSPSAICEGYDAALIRAGFYRLEAREMAQYKQEMHSKPETRIHDRIFIQRLRRSMRTHGAHEILTKHLPRVMQLAACLIAVIALGAGVAIASSESARNWAAGVLLGSEGIVVEEASGFSWGDPPEPATGFAGGTNIGNTTWLMDANNRILRRVDGTNSEPVLYEYTDSDDFEPLAIETDGENLFLITSFVQDTDNDGNPIGAKQLNVGRVVLSEGSYSLESVFAGSFEGLFGLDDSIPHQGNLESSTYANGKLYLLAYCQLANSNTTPQDYRLIEIDPLSGRGAAYAIPDEVADFWFFNVEVFAGPQNRLHVGCDCEDSTWIFRLEDDHSYTKICSISGEDYSYVKHFAWDDENATLYYIANDCIYATPDMDASQAKIVAHTNEDGRILLLGDSCMIVNSDRARVYDLTSGTSEDIVLTFCGGTGLNEDIADAMREEHSDLSFTDAWVDKDDDGNITLPTGVDIWDMGYDELDYALKEGKYTAIRSDIVAEAVAKLPDYLQAICTKDGEIIAVPQGLNGIMCDYGLNLKLMQKLGLGTVPETWGEFLNLLNELSHGTNADQICLYDSDGESLRTELFDKIVNTFVRTRQFQNQSVDFGDSAFQALMEQLRQIDLDAFEYVSDCTEQNSGRMLFYDTYDYDYYSVMGESDFSPYTFRLSDSDPIISQGYAYLLMIDPDSAHYDLAVEYLEHAVQNYDSAEREMVFGEILSGADFDASEARDELNKRIGTVVYTCNTPGHLPYMGPKLESLAEYFFSGTISCEDLTGRMNEATSKYYG